jgi:hypothetical protein
VDTPFEGCNQCPTPSKFIHVSFEGELMMVCNAMQTGRREEERRRKERNREGKKETEKEREEEREKERDYSTFNACMSKRV